MKLKAWLKERKIKQCDFAYLLEISAQYLSIVINGKPPSIELAKIISLITHGKVRAEDIISGKALGNKK